MVKTCFPRGPKHDHCPRHLESRHRQEQIQFGYTIVYAPSVTQALTFYEDAFGFETRFLDESQQYRELATGTTVLAFASYVMGHIVFGGALME